MNEKVVFTITRQKEGYACESAAYDSKGIRFDKEKAKPWVIALIATAVEFTADVLRATEKAVLTRVVNDSIGELKATEVLLDMPTPKKGEEN